jgi:mannose/cellobiose epimerase-like protein (N-acyl-D-glucosamine 2-epimerase family)
LLHCKATLERILIENIIPFWRRDVIDLKDGGYRLNHDIWGKWKGKAKKSLVTQARTLWFFSRLASTRYGSPENLGAASHGYLFLRNRMWDKKYGGFFWEVNSTGRLASKPYKQLYGQAFGLNAIAEYAKVTGDCSALEITGQLFDLLENHGHDTQYGGYIESFNRDWGPLPANKINLLNSLAKIKLMNTHLHLVEALTSYYLLTKNLKARLRLKELIFTLCDSVVNKSVGCCTDKFQRDWTPLRGSLHDRVSYGHDLENIWLLFATCHAVGISNFTKLNLYRTIFSNAVRYGFDRKEGGFYDSGRLKKPADKSEKIWWVQAEALVTTLLMHCITGDEIHFSYFTQTLDWIAKHQVDWQNGDWYMQVEKNGRASGDKAGNWKSPYHNGRAVMICLELISLLSNIDSLKNPWQEIGIILLNI